MARRSVPRPDLTGQKFGRWLVIGPADPPTDAKRCRAWRCRCECGTEATKSGDGLRKSNSCGCYRNEVTAARNRTHGMTHLPEYAVWAGMKQRCTDPRHIAFPLYGGRGITVCPRWQDFSAFYADMGPRPSKAHSLDRIDNDGPYEPGNVRWATAREQLLNNSRTRRLTFNGETLSLTEWSERTGLVFATILDRLAHGWPTEKVLTTPPREILPLQVIDWNGKSLTLREWAAETGLPLGTLRRRASEGWPAERLLTKPVRVTRRR